MNKKKEKIIKKKSFYFEDYAESELTDSNNIYNLVKISLNRVTFLFFIFISIIFIFSIKITYLSLIPEKNFYSENSDQKFISISLVSDKAPFMLKWSLSE